MLAKDCAVQPAMNTVVILPGGKADPPRGIRPQFLSSRDEAAVVVSGNEASESEAHQEAVRGREIVAVRSEARRENLSQCFGVSAFPQGRRMK